MTNDTTRPITAADLMNPVVLTVGEAMTVRELASFLTDNEISGAPVSDKNGKLVGVVSATDIAALASGAGSELPADSAGFFRQDALPESDDVEIGDDRLEGPELDLTVRDIMTDEIHAVGEDASVSSIASLMLHTHIHRILVTRDDEAIGIISTSDLLGLLVDPED